MVFLFQNFTSEKDIHTEDNIIAVEIIEVLNEKNYLYKAVITNKEDSKTILRLITKI